ncbi:MAG TPA: hypothetical protein VK797_16865 [Tepidisphaeraceae bacterium]|jgi:hypothetical protein|nr:hypothetical protein [Tepidisphaeraceae bacterium]
MEGVVSSQFFRVDGADSESGQETFLVLRAKSKPHAERLARKQGLLVATVRVAKPADWEQTPHKATAAPPIEHANNDPIMDKAERGVEKPLSAAAPLQPLPRPSEGAQPGRATAQRTGAAPIMLSAIAGALIVGGVLALSLALWPDDAARNELQQVDFRLHELSQTVLGSVLVLGGLIVFAVAAVLYSGKAK